MADLKKIRAFAFDIDGVMTAPRTDLPSGWQA